MQLPYKDNDCGRETEANDGMTSERQCFVF